MTPTWSASSTPSSRPPEPGRSATARCGSPRWRRSCGYEPASAATTRSDALADPAVPAAPLDPAALTAAFRAARDGLIADRAITGRAFAEGLRELVDRWLGELFAFAAAETKKGAAGLALVAVGGYGRGDLCPGSDIDVLLLHDGRRDIAAVAEQLWYPVWDAGVQLGHSVRTTKEALAF